MKMETRIFTDIAALNRGTLEEIHKIIADAVAQRGRACVALSGGHTPAQMYALWAAEVHSRTPWDRLHFFWGDERYVAHDDPLSNYRMACETLISRVPIPAANVHPYPTSLRQPQDTADAYEAELRAYFAGAPPEFDVQLLGIGEEGHTASLFPGSPALEEVRRWVAAVEVPATPPRRLTLTPAVLNLSRHTLFLVAGESKRGILGKLRDEANPQTSIYPAARIRPSGQVLWFLDQAAGSF
ncbi:MAG: 6-phosphogluconolactonase [Candidatus Acidiferrales bacterium]